MPPNNEWSFIIPTSGDRPESLARLIHSIHSNLFSNKWEIIISYPQSFIDGGGKVFPDKRVISVVSDLPDRKKNTYNLMIDRSSYKNLAILNDDSELYPGWYLPFLDFPFEMCGCVCMTPRRQRYWDWTWAEKGDDRVKGGNLLDYPTIPHPVNLHYGQYLSGCAMFYKRDIHRFVQWNENLFWGQGEDSDFCHRVIDMGFRMSFNHASIVVHHMHGR